ncbi:MAG: CDP-archaeol synthase [Proteobacteria bacterium]|jgi:phosphatidate cytidylyltransferase|nr:CDP-archaeol synthase [Pseudomonadales bacterium]MDA0804973.1 CDP-archaeol synthase [Pseudomonadota bacterium]MDA0895315.1 CDP-archaeol synthase [Pseudomonadota bacterium]MDA1243735.1 CDP-archaeol synthase [Pseudomonadota bacterium]
MLKQRIATALILLVGLIAMTTILDLEQFAAITAALVLIGAWEWAAFASLGSKSRLAFVGTLALSIAPLWFALGVGGAPGYDASFALGFSLLGALFWVLMFAAIASFPRSTDAWNDKSRISVMGMLSLLCTWVGLVSLKALLPNGALVIMLIIMVAAVDVGAFFTGKLFGKRKLAPALSPNKTWEGVWGGVTLNVAVSIVFAILLNNYVQPFSLIDYAIFAALALIVAFFSVVGDLAESMLKRNRELKDSGSILPGHGGLLDRIDGLMAATPICVAFLILLLGGV